MRRVWQIHRVVRKYGLTEFFGREPGRHDRPRGERLRLALEELGPVFVKLGQALSTRPDVVPADLATELAKLQDQVPSFPGIEAKAIVEKSLGKKLEDMFSEFDLVPMASASVAQVHAARMKPASEGDPGLNVVVKVIRPGIEKVIHSDIQLLHTLAEQAESFSEYARRIRPRAIVAEY
ncbi:MAG: AarF/UbiB family protein, partial [Rhodanobacteraceae bacterium]